MQDRTREDTPDLRYVLAALPSPSSAFAVVWSQRGERAFGPRPHQRRRKQWAPSRRGRSPVAQEDRSPSAQRQQTRSGRAAPRRACPRWPRWQWDHPAFTSFPSGQCPLLL